MLTLSKAVVAACAALLLCCCQPLRDEINPTSVGVGGVRPTLEQLNVTSDTAVQNALVNDLVVKAGLSQMPPPGSGDWQYVTEAGLYEIGRQCDQYIDVLFRFNRNQRAVRQGLTATGAATAAILGLAGVAALPIALTATAFGLAATLYDAGVNSVLYSVEPSALRNIVLRGRQAYIDRLDLAKVSSRPRMMIALQGYLVQCSPAAIEANVNNAASGAESVISIKPGGSSAPAVLGAPAVTLIERAAAVTGGRVTNAPQPLVQAAPPRAAQPRERAFLRGEVVGAQVALGVAPANGDFDQSTREAIREFQRGMNRKHPSSWPVRDGTGNLADLPPALGPMPKLFRSPFERAYLGAYNAALPLEQQYEEIDPNYLIGIRTRLGSPPKGSDGWPVGESQADLARTLEMVRAKLGERADPANPAPVPLTSAIFDRLPRAAAGPGAVPAVVPPAGTGGASAAPEPLLGPTGGGRQ